MEGWEEEKILPIDWTLRREAGGGEGMHACMNCMFRVGGGKRGVMPSSCVSIHLSLWRAVGRLMNRDDVGRGGEGETLRLCSCLGKHRGEEGVVTLLREREKEE